MNRAIAPIILGLSLMISAGAWAQSAGAIAPTPSTAVAAPTGATAPAAGVPAVESIDILKQNQAERSRDQPGNLAPTWRQVVAGTPNTSSLPALESSVLIQPKAQFPGQDRGTTAGEAWRQYRNGPLTQVGGWLFVLALIGAGAAYLLLGTTRLKQPCTGRLIERFTRFERAVHWSTAISFLTLAVSGLAMLFGKHVLLPVFGHTLFGWLAIVLKNLHNFIGPVFTVSVVLTMFLFVKDNLPRSVDLQWFRTLGGLIGKKRVHAGRFNAGQKLWFWGGVVVLSLIASASGFVLDALVPIVEATRANMQLAHVVHVVAAILLLVFSVGHIYLGTIGQEGSYRAMRDGYVDDAWAKEHHDLWYDDIQAGRVSRVRSRRGATTTGDLANGPLTSLSQPAPQAPQAP